MEPWMIASILGFLVLMDALLLGMWTAERRRNVDLVDHAKCVAHLAYYVGDTFAARVLRETADAFESVESDPDLRRIANTVWELGGPTVPTLWMRERAEYLDQTAGMTEP